MIETLAQKLFELPEWRKIARQRGRWEYPHRVGPSLLWHLRVHCSVPVNASTGLRFRIIWELWSDWGALVRFRGTVRMVEPGRIEGEMLPGQGSGESE